MKIRVVNESPKRINALYYDVIFTVGDDHGDDKLYFHACFNRQAPTALREITKSCRS